MSRDPYDPMVHIAESLERIAGALERMHPDEAALFDRGMRKVRMSEELLVSLAAQGRDDITVWVEWGDPDAQGFYTPTLHTKLREVA